MPYADGGANELVAPLLVVKLQAELKQPFIIERRLGVGVVVGMASVAKAPADGYTVVIGEPCAMSINPSFL